MRLPSTRSPSRIVVLLTSVICAACGADDTSAVTQWAASSALRVRTVESEPDTSDLRAVAQLIGPAGVVAVGEPSHGNHEPMAFRNRLFQFLVEEHGFTAIAIETGLAEAGQVQAFVAEGDGDAARVVRDNLTYGFGAFADNLALVEWMRDYNADPRHARQLRFYGIDVSLGGPRNATPTPVALETALSYVARIDADEAARIRGRVQPVLTRLRVSNPESISAAERAVLTAAIESTIDTLEKNPSARELLGEEHVWAYRTALAARQTDELFRLMPPPRRDGIPPDTWRQMTARDESMADNVQWALNREGPNGKMLVFAHNTHVQNAPVEGGVWASLDRAPESMGQHLRRVLGRDLFILGTAVARGPIDLRPESSPESVEAPLGQIGVPLFVLDLRLPNTDPHVTRWLTTRRTLKAGGTAETVAIGGAFDALLYIDRVSIAMKIRGCPDPARC